MLNDHATLHNRALTQVDEVVARLASLEPQVLRVMTQFEATGDTAKDIRDAIRPQLETHERRLNEFDSMRTELAEHERRLKELTTRITLAVKPVQLDDIGRTLSADALRAREQLEALQRQVEGQQESLEQVETRIAARLITFESDFGLRTETSGLPRASFSPPVPNRASLGRGRESRGSFGSQGAYESSRGDQRDFGPASFLQDPSTPVGEGSPHSNSRRTMLAPGDVLGKYLESVNPSAAPSTQAMHADARPEKLSIDTKHVPDEYYWYGEYTMVWTAPGEHQKHYKKP